MSTRASHSHRLFLRTLLTELQAWKGGGLSMQTLASRLVMVHQDAHYDSCTDCQNDPLLTTIVDELAPDYDYQPDEALGREFAAIINEFIHSDFFNEM